MRANTVCIMILAAVMALSMAACVPREAAPAIESVGEIVEFGNWRGEPIAWRVLDIEDDRALLISEDVLELRQYDGLERYYGERLSDADIDWNSVSITWADSEIRAWLNDDFLSEAFSAGERRAIRLSEISNPDNPKYGTLGGRDTEDRVFLLSIDEAERYFYGSDDRMARLTITQADIAYVIEKMRDSGFVSQELLREEEEFYRSEYLNQSQACWWWLRSPGHYGRLAAGVYGSGVIDIYGYNVRIIDFSGVRPALYINL